MVHHVLKTWPAPFEAVWRGDKTFEVRLDDRCYQKGDTFTLREWDRFGDCSCPTGEHAPDCARYSGRTIDGRIGHVLASTAPRGNQRGFNGMGYVVFSVCDQRNVDPRPGKAAAAADRIAAAPRAVPS